MNNAPGRLDQADAEGALDLDIIAECASKIDALKVAGVGAQTPEQQPESGGNGGLRQLQFTDIGLEENNGFRDPEESCAIRDAPGS